MSKIYKVVTPNDLSDTSFDKGVNTPNKIEIKLQYSIANLKTRTNLPNVVYITDNGKEGLFEYDSTDTTSVGDDTLIIVTNSGKRYKKITESLTNKSTDINLGTSDTLYPTQKAVKNYIDTLLNTITSNISFIWSLFTGFSIVQLRNLTNLQLGLVNTFYCNEIGKEGKWYYDSTDTTSTDNTGTVLVTTSGKRLKRRNQYDFVRLSWFILDYNADNTTICSYVFNNFSRVYLAKGEIVKVSSVQIDSEVELFGLGKLNKLANTELAVLEVNSNNFKFYNIEIDGNRDNQTSSTARGINTSSNFSYFDINNSKIKNCYGEAIRVQSISNVNITNNYITNSNQAGNSKAIIIRHQFGSASNIVIENNFIDVINSKNGGIAVQVAHTPYFCENLKIKSNTVLLGEVGDNSNTGFAKESLGIELYSGYGIDNNGLIKTFEIVGNIIECKGVGEYSGVISTKYAYGISLGGGSWNGVNGGIRNGSVINNKVIGCRRLSYEIIASDVVVNSNTSINSGEVSINSQDVDGGMKNIQFVNNILKNTGGVLGYSQIRLQSGLNSLYNVKVNGNTIDGGIENNDSIILIGTNTDVDKSNFYDIEITSNTVINNPNSAVYIRDTANVFGIDINDNIIEMNHSNNVGAIVFSAKTSTDCRIINNKFKTSNENNNYYAIQVTGGDNHKNLSVINNTSNKYSRGLSTSGNIEGILYYGNNFKNCSVYGLNLQNSPTGVITGANIYNNNTVNEIISNTAGITGTFGQAIKNVVYTTGTGLTPVSGVVAITNTLHGIIGSGVTQLTTINGGQSGQLLIIYPNDNTNTIIVKDGTGNLRLSGDFIMNHNQDRLMLQYDGGNWIELSRSDNAEEQSGRTTLVSGTKTFTVEGLTSSSNVILSKFVGGGTHNTTLYYRAIPSTDSLTINALTTADAINTTDTSTLIYTVL